MKYEIKEQDDGKTSIVFSIGADTRVLNDAIVLTPQEFSALSPAQIESIIQSRFDNWCALLDEAVAANALAALEGEPNAYENDAGMFSEEFL